MVHHTIGFPVTGLLGVELFFVLSGFLITTLLVEEHVRNGRVSIRNFYRRRALRLLPALVALLGVFLAIRVVAVAIRGGSLDTALFGVLAGLGYFTNIARAAGPAGDAAIPSELGHLWSLAIEEQFYLVWPLVLVVLLRARVRLALVVLGAALALAAVQQIRLHLDGASEARIVFGSDSGSTAIVVGCVLALLLTTAARPTIEKAARLLAPLAVACVGVLLVVVPDSQFFSAWVLAVAVYSAWLILLSLNSGSLLARTLSVRPLVYLGCISYALYLWHIPIYVMFGLSTNPELLDIPALALSLVCAIASYHFVELPFLRRKREPRSELEKPGRSDDRVSPSPALSPVAP